MTVMKCKLWSWWSGNSTPHCACLHARAGPALSIDTACSSSLSGTSLLAGMLLRGRCSRGLLTAALLTLDPATIGMLAAANMLAPDGRCKTLDATADGCVGSSRTRPVRAMAFNPLTC